MQPAVLLLLHLRLLAHLVLLRMQRTQPLHSASATPFWCACQPHSLLLRTCTVLQPWHWRYRLLLNPPVTTPSTATSVPLRAMLSSSCPKTPTRQLLPPRQLLLVCSIPQDHGARQQQGIPKVGQVQLTIALAGAVDPVKHKVFGGLPLWPQVTQPCTEL